MPDILLGARESSVKKTDKAFAAMDLFSSGGNGE